MDVTPSNQPEPQRNLSASGGACAATKSHPTLMIFRTGAPTAYTGSVSADWHAPAQSVPRIRDHRPRRYGGVFLRRAEPHHPDPCFVPQGRAADSSAFQSLSVPRSREERRRCAAHSPPVSAPKGPRAVATSGVRRRRTELVERDPHRAPRPGGPPDRPAYEPRGNIEIRPGTDVRATDRRPAGARTVPGSVSTGFARPPEAAVASPVATTQRPVGARHQSRWSDDHEWRDREDVGKDKPFKVQGRSSRSFKSRGDGRRGRVRGHHAQPCWITSASCRRPSEQCAVPSALGFQVPAPDPALKCGAGGLSCLRHYVIPCRSFSAAEGAVSTRLRSPETL